MICPKCTGEMRKVGIRVLTTTIEVERCSGCGGMFFDSGEAELLIKLSEELGRETTITSKVIAEILQERKHRNEKWGEQHHGAWYWLCVLMEEVGEASKDWQQYRKELIHVAAVAVAAIEDTDWHPEQKKPLD